MLLSTWITKNRLNNGSRAMLTDQPPPGTNCLFSYTMLDNTRGYPHPFLNGRTYLHGVGELPRTVSRTLSDFASKHTHISCEPENFVVDRASYVPAVGAHQKHRQMVVENRLSGISSILDTRRRRRFTYRMDLVRQGHR